MMATLRKRADIHPPNAVVVGKSNKRGSVHGETMHAVAAWKAWAGVLCVLALVLCANAASTARSELSSNGKSILQLREVTSRRNCSTFSDPGKGIRAQDYWIYRALGGGHFYDASRMPKFELSWRLVTGSLIAMLGSALGSVGGVGGGGFYLPMLNVVMGFDSTSSISLSKAMVMGVAISAVLFNLKTKHPTEPRAVINYEFALLYQPMILLGISTGVILNTLLPDWIVTFFLVILFTKIVVITSKRASLLAEEEKLKRQNNARNAAIYPGSQESENGDYVAIPSNSRNSQSDSNSADHGKVTWKWFPARALTILFVTWFFFLALQIVRALTRECSFLYWVATLLQVPVAVGVTIWAAFKSSFAVQGKRLDREEFPPATKGTDGENRGLRNLVLSLLGFVAGLAGGCLGVGGGGILGPGFLELGLSPQESSSTASFIMIFSSSLSVVEYYILGQLAKNFAIYFIILSVVTSIFGQIVIKKIVQASGRTSLIVYALVGCVAVGNVTLGAMGVLRSVEQYEAGENMGIQKFCPSQ